MILIGIAFTDEFCFKIFISKLFAVLWMTYFDAFIYLILIKSSLRSDFFFNFGRWVHHCLFIKADWKQEFVMSSLIICSLSQGHCDSCIFAVQFLQTLCSLMADFHPQHGPCTCSRQSYPLAQLTKYSPNTWKIVFSRTLTPQSFL